MLGSRDMKKLLAMIALFSPLISCANTNSLVSDKSDASGITIILENKKNMNEMRARKSKNYYRTAKRHCKKYNKDAEFDSANFARKPNHVRYVCR